MSQISRNATYLCRTYCTTCVPNRVSKIKQNRIAAMNGERLQATSLPAKAVDSCFQKKWFEPVLWISAAMCNKSAKGQAAPRRPPRRAARRAPQTCSGRGFEARCRTAPVTFSRQVRWHRQCITLSHDRRIAKVIDDGARVALLRTIRSNAKCYTGVQ